MHPFTISRIFEYEYVEWVQYSKNTLFQQEVYSTKFRKAMLLNIVNTEKCQKKLWREGGWVQYNFKCPICQNVYSNIVILMSLFVLRYGRLRPTCVQLLVCVVVTVTATASSKGSTQTIPQSTQHTYHAIVTRQDIFLRSKFKA